MSSKCPAKGCNGDGTTRPNRSNGDPFIKHYSLRFCPLVNKNQRAEHERVNEEALKEIIEELFDTKEEMAMTISENVSFPN